MKPRAFKFRLRGRTWEVRFVEKMPESEDLGQTDNETQIVHVRTTGPDDLVIATFWHEFGHVALECLHVDVAHHEEDIVSVIGDALTEVVPQLPSWLRRAKK